MTLSTLQRQRMFQRLEYVSRGLPSPAFCGMSSEEMSLEECRMFLNCLARQLQIQEEYNRTVSQRVDDAIAALPPCNPSPLPDPTISLEESNRLTGN